MSQTQPELCTTHRIRLLRDDPNSKAFCPVCAQLSNQEMQRRRSRRR